jgi:hypothetical protein
MPPNRSYEDASAWFLRFTVGVFSMHRPLFRACEKCLQAA